MSTRGDVERLLGKPEMVMVTGGTTTLVYMHMRMENGIPVPIVEILAGQSKMKSEHLMVTIGADGKVSDMTSGNQDMTINTGLLNTNR